MLTFLRKIRKSLIESGSARKYILYAIGEIALVVIGILIALQINTWNENRKIRIAEKQALINLKEEFQKNHKDLLDHIEWKSGIQEEWKVFLDTLTNPNLPKEQRFKKRPIASFVYYNISNSVLNSLLNTGNIDNIQNDSLKYLLVTWEDDIKDYSQFQEMHAKFVSDQLFPFERDLLPNENNYRYGYDFTFPSAKKNLELFEVAYNIPAYQHILLQNFFWINIQITRIANLVDKMVLIIHLLDAEIKLRNGN